MATYQLLVALTAVYTISFCNGLSCFPCGKLVCPTTEPPISHSGTTKQPDLIRPLGSGSSQDGCIRVPPQCDEPAPDCVQPRLIGCSCCPVCAASLYEDCGIWQRHCAPRTTCVQFGSPGSIGPLFGGKCVPDALAYFFANLPKSLIVTVV